MSGVELIGKPTINGIEIPTDAECLKRHVVLHGMYIWVNASAGSGAALQLGQGDGGAQFLLNAFNGWMEWDLGILEAGSWKLWLQHWSGSDRGIAAWSIDGTLIGSWVDTYAATGAFIYPTATFTLSASQPRRLRLTCTGRNASSTGYIITVSRFSLDRTGP